MGVEVVVVAVVVVMVVVVVVGRMFDFVSSRIRASHFSGCSVCKHASQTRLNWIWWNSAPVRRLHAEQFCCTAHARE